MRSQMVIPWDETCCFFFFWLLSWEGWRVISIMMSMNGMGLLMVRSKSSGCTS